MNLDGRRMRCVQTAANGIVGHDTVFSFCQTGNCVEARYTGGRIAVGYLVRIIDHDELSFRYCQISDGVRMDGGVSRCRVETTTDGRVRIIESFNWDSQSGGGVNVFEEVEKKSD